MSDRINDLRRELLQHVIAGVDVTDSQKLGEGCFGIVKSVRYEGKLCACKLFRDYLIGPTSAEKTMTALLLECKNSLNLSHPNIVKFHGLYFPAEASFPSIVMEYLPYCLGKFLSGEESALQLLSELKPFILSDVANGLYYLHSCNIMHRDLTANNILLTDTWDAKISDFGQAKVIDMRQVRASHTAIPGTPIYMPPEATRGSDPLEYDFSLDVFSYGVLILHMYLGKLPNPINEYIRDEHNRTILSPPLDYFKYDIETAFSTDDTFKSLSKRCLEESPSRRPSKEELVIETEDIKKEKFSSFKKNYVELDIREKEASDDACTVREENKILWENLKKFTTIMKKSDKFQDLQKSARSESGPSTWGRSPLLKSMQSSGEDTLTNSENEESMMSLPDVRLGQDATIEVLERDLHQANTDNAELREECERLREENVRLRHQSQLEGSLSLRSLQNVPVQEFIPPTISKVERKRLLQDDNIFVSIEAVSQDRLSFNDVKGAHAVFCQGKVYIGRASNCIWMYDTIMSVWRKVEHAAPVKNFGLAVYRNRVILVGGLISEGKISSEIWALNEDETWQRNFICPMPQSRENPAVAVSVEDLIAMGGTSTGFYGTYLKALDSVDIFDGREWKRATAKLERAAEAMQCFINSGYLYILNPDGWTIRYCSVEALISSVKTKIKQSVLWKSVPREIPHAHSCVFVYDNTLLAISGTNSDGLLYGYDPDKSQWIRVRCTQRVLPAIKNATCLSIGGMERLFLCGGVIDMFTDATKASFVLSVGTAPPFFNEPDYVDVGATSGSSNGSHRGSHRGSNGSQRGSNGSQRGSIG